MQKFCAESPVLMSFGGVNSCVYTRDTLEVNLFHSSKYSGNLNSEENY